MSEHSELCADIIMEHLEAQYPKITLVDGINNKKTFYEGDTIYEELIQFFESYNKSAGTNKTTETMSSIGSKQDKDMVSLLARERKIVEEMKKCSDDDKEDIIKFIEVLRGGRE